MCVCVGGGGGKERERERGGTLTRHTMYLNAAFSSVREFKIIEKKNVLTTTKPLIVQMPNSNRRLSQDRMEQKAIE